MPGVRRDPGHPAGLGHRRSLDVLVIGDVRFGIGRMRLRWRVLLRPLTHAAPGARNG